MCRRFAAEDVDVLAPFVSLCRGLAKIAVTVAEGSSIDRVRVEFMGRIAERDTRLLAIDTLIGVLSGHIEEQAGVLNAPAIANERGIELVESKTSTAHDYSDLIRVTSTPEKAASGSWARCTDVPTGHTCSRSGVSASTSSSRTRTPCSAIGTYRT
jgi:phosphogluconate dehydrogenase-like protein